MENEKGDYAEKLLLFCLRERFESFSEIANVWNLRHSSAEKTESPG